MNKIETQIITGCGTVENSTPHYLYPGARFRLSRRHKWKIVREILKANDDTLVILTFGRNGCRQTILQRYQPIQTFRRVYNDDIPF